MDRIIPVAVIHDEAEAERILSALERYGSRCIEITFRTPYAAEAIRYAKKNHPAFDTGAGTVISPGQCEEAIDAGAAFIVSPGLSAKCAEICRDRGVRYIPGCVTPTEIMEAINLGIDTVKFFPAETFGGIKAIKALSAPFPQVGFVPTGGIDRSNLDRYLECPAVKAVGGTFIIKEALVDSGNRL